jgi:hypothetical protein
LGHGNVWLDSEPDLPLGPFSKAVGILLAAMMFMAAAWFLSTLHEAAAIIAGAWRS